MINCRSSVFTYNNAAPRSPEMQKKGLIAVARWPGSYGECFLTMGLAPDEVEMRRVAQLCTRPSFNIENTP